ncbi:hypothetical protein CIW83_05240 [Tissierella sp. P1]|jgi:hypothetical protein|uniref:hypothetical protein n=1 Tax=Tissierella TaxID=41273 RepID=UPI000BA09EAB|nr:hypothetical protein [Tissierella sp. P1]MDU5080081.1 hypothetical protein [Bacillota bacterium]OZV13279.1 hypothetical protein CIW83_05240 [Tissierella sp. P1]
MKNNQMNGYIIWGLLINSIVLGSKQFIEMPEGIYCFGMGVGIALVLFGLYSMNHDTTKIKSFKRNLIKKFIKSI